MAPGADHGTRREHIGRDHSLSRDAAIVGVSDHCGWAVLVTVAAGGTLQDRRRVELVDEGLPKLPHHHEAQALPLPEALELIERVRASAHRHAKLALDAVATAFRPPILGIALRQCPRLPPTVAERIRDYRAQNVADTVMYREALASAADGRGWAIHWYDAKRVFTQACDALHIEDLETHFAEVRKSIGPPWSKDHKLAMAAAIVAAADHNP
jgi:hypothetical protein